MDHNPNFIKEICRCVTWSQTKASGNMVVVMKWTVLAVSLCDLAVSERAMDCRMPGVSLRDRVNNQILRQISCVKNIVVATRGSTVGPDTLFALLTTGGRRVTTSSIHRKGTATQPVSKKLVC